MIKVLVRGFSTVMTVVIAVIVSATVGDSAAGRIWAAIFIAAFIALVEWLLIWMPKRSAVARRLLDPRSSLVGVWLQVVRQRVSGDPSGRRNRFALFWVDYGADGYQVTGCAFDEHGTEVARWSSLGTPDFGPDGQSMTYVWEGEVTGEAEPVDDIDRTGVSRFSLRERRGRVDHVGMRSILLFDIEAVSPQLLKELGLADIGADKLKEPDAKSRFAAEYAKRLVPAGARRS